MDQQGMGKCAGCPTRGVVTFGSGGGGGNAGRLKWLVGGRDGSGAAGLHFVSEQQRPAAGSDPVLPGLSWSAVCLESLEGPAGLWVLGNALTGPFLVWEGFFYSCNTDRNHFS